MAVKKREETEELEKKEEEEKEERVERPKWRLVEPWETIEEFVKEGHEAIPTQRTLQLSARSNVSNNNNNKSEK